MEEEKRAQEVVDEVSAMLELERLAGHVRDVRPGDVLGVHKPHDATATVSPLPRGDRADDEERTYRDSSDFFPRLPRSPAAQVATGAPLVSSREVPMKASRRIAVIAARKVKQLAANAAMRAAEAESKQRPAFGRSPRTGG